MESSAAWRPVFQSLCLLLLVSLALASCSRDAEIKVEVTPEPTPKTAYVFEDPGIKTADSLRALRDYAAALPEYQKAKQLFQEEENWEGYIYAYEREAYCYRRSGRDSISKITYVGVIEKAREYLGESHVLLSKAMFEAGRGEHFRREYDVASNMLDTAMDVYSNSIHYDSALYRTLIDYKFYTYFSSKKSNDTAIKYLDLKQRLVDSSEPSRQLFDLSLNYVRIYRDLGDFERALAYAQESVRIGMNDSVGIPKRQLIDALFNLAAVQYDQGSNENSINVVNDLMEIAADVLAPDDAIWSQYYNLIAINLNSLKKYELAAQQFLKAVKILEVNNFRHDGYWGFLMNLGICYDRLGYDEQAEHYLLRALKGQQELSGLFSPKTSTRYIYTAEFFDRISKHELSLGYYDSALRSTEPSYRGQLLEAPSNEQVVPSYPSLRALRGKLKQLAKLYTKSKSPEVAQSALNYANLAHSVLKYNRENFDANEGKLFVSKEYKDIYSLGIEVSYELHKNSPIELADSLMSIAFKFMSLGKANVLLEQAGDFGAIKDAKVPISLRSEYFNLLKSLESIDSEFYRLMELSATSDSIRVLNSRRMVINARLKALKDSAANFTGNNGNLVEQIEIHRVEQLKEKLNRGEMFVEYFVFGETIYAIGLTKNQGFFKRIALDDDFKLAFNGLLSIVNQPPRFGDKDNEGLRSYSTKASSLYNYLLGPMLDEIENEISVLRIVPDEQLARIPFEALISDYSGNEQGFHELNYLAKQFFLTYRLSSRLEGQKITNRIPGKKVLGFGYSGNSSSDSRSEFGDLPGTIKEIEFLKTNIPGDYYFGDQGTKEVFLREAQNYEILHVAVHGVADMNDRFNSRLIFNGTTDNEIKTSDLYVANLNARLAVLSACESGIGEINQGEGTFSIARGFSLIGVPSVVMSLWRVNDQTASKLMVDLHQQLLRNASIGEAITLTKRNYLETADEYSAHPYYWSAFVALGEDSTLYEQRSGWELWALIVVIFAVTVLLIIYRSKKRRPKL